MTTARKTQGKANPIPWDDDYDPDEELETEAAPPDPSVPTPNELPENPPVSEAELNQNSTSVFLVNGDFEFSLNRPRLDSISIMANNCHFALFIEDHKIGSKVDGFQKTLAGNSDNSQSVSDIENMGRGKSVILEPLLSKLRDKPEQTKVILTEKNKRSHESAAQALKQISRLGEMMELSDTDGKLLKIAGAVYGLIKYGRFESSTSSQMSKSDFNLLKRLNFDPAILSIIGLVYCNLEDQSLPSPTARLKIANILTAVDLFIDNMDSNEPISSELYERMSTAYRQLTDKLLFKDVVDSLLSLVGEEVSSNTVRPDFNRVLIYSHQARGLYSLEARLKNEKFAITTIGTPEKFVVEYKRRPPDMIILHFSTNPTGVIKELHQFLSKGLAIGSVPAYVLVKDTVVGRLTPLLDMGIEEILDLESQLDLLIHKIKKARSTMKAAWSKDKSDISTVSISRGDLSLMGIIDLLQAMGPSRRTTRITVTPQDTTTQSLVLHLDEGKIVHALLDDLKGEEAVYAAMRWENGTWQVEPLKPEEIPEPNISLANEAILMEGCRLLDEQNR